MENHHTSGLTSRLILSYVEREKGHEAVGEVLRLCGLEDHEAELRDENHWFDFRTKIRLFEAAAEVLDDPDVALHIGGAALDFNIATGLKLALRAVGSPKQVYANIVRASGKFTWAHTWEVLELEDDRACIRYKDVSGVGYQRLDCLYNRGLLSCVPAIFGMPAAEITHDECALEGARTCVYDIRWEARSVRALPAVALAAGTVAAIALATVAAPALIPVALALPALGIAALFYREQARLRAVCRSLRLEVREEQEVSNRLSGSLHDLVSDLRIDEVLAKVIVNATAAVGGKEYVLLLGDGEYEWQARGSQLAPPSLRALERWAARSEAVFDGPTTVDDLSETSSLSALAGESGVPLLSLCAAPLLFKQKRLGLLVALAYGPRAFLPHDATLLESYAAQAAVALSNAHLVERLERLARQDPLTELLNHREFHEAVELEIARCSRSASRFAVLLLDLDDFKRVNDENGHAEGDEVLRKLAAVIKEVCRKSDVPCRVGGDEFGIVLPESGAAAARSLAERIEAALNAFDPPIRFSSGVAQWPEHGSTKELLLLQADMDLYRSKSSPEPVQRTAVGTVSHIRLP